MRTCEPIFGEAAEGMGLVSLCVPAEELHERAAAIAASLARGPRDAIRWTKHALNGWLRGASESFELSLAYEVLGGFSGPEGREGLAALREERRPSFSAL